MKTIKSYTFPALLTLVSGVTAFADVAQDAFVAELLAFCLIAIGIGSILLLKLPGISAHVRGRLPSVGHDFSPVAFGISCALLGIVALGMSQISIRMSDQGGIIATAYPEVQNLQAQLGVVDRKVEQVAAAVEATAATVDTIADQTSFLTKAAGQWIAIETLEISVGAAPSAQFMLRLSNPSSFVFDSVDVVVRQRGKPDATYLHETGIIAQGERKYWVVQLPTRPEELEVCISGRRASDGLWGIERRDYGDPDNSQYPDYYTYRVTATDGLMPGAPEMRCT